MWRLACCFTLVCSLSGCATYSWYHPAKGPNELNQDKYVCLQQATKDFPVTLVEEVYRAAYVSPAETACRSWQSKDQREERTNCTTTPSAYHPPEMRIVDVNQRNRDNAVTACLNSLGWSLRKDP